MASVLDELVTLLSLERIEENLFRGQSQDLGWGTVFGGQVLGQALSAAAQTVTPDRRVHSLQSYFLRPGDVSKPIVYEVDRIRDGSSFTTRRVVAIQSGQPIFNLAASFQIEEPGFEHQSSMPTAPPPESLPTEAERYKKHLDRLPKLLRDRTVAERPFEFRIVGEADDDPIHPQVRAPTRLAWFRTAGKLPDDPALHAYLLAYTSDHGFMTTSLLPHGVSWLTPGMQVASLDHALWFHRSFRIDEWMLYAMESPRAGGSRGLAQGRIFTRDGTLVATCVQEGLIRQRKKPTPAG